MEWLLIIFSLEESKRQMATHLTGHHHHQHQHLSPSSWSPSWSPAEDNKQILQTQWDRWQRVSPKEHQPHSQKEDDEEEENSVSDPHHQEQPRRLLRRPQETKSFKLLQEYRMRQKPLLEVRDMLGSNHLTVSPYAPMPKFSQEFVKHARNPSAPVRGGKVSPKCPGRKSEVKIARTSPRYYTLLGFVGSVPDQACPVPPNSTPPQPSFLRKKHPNNNIAQSTKSKIHGKMCPVPPNFHENPALSLSSEISSQVCPITPDVLFEDVCPIPVQSPFKMLFHPHMTQGVSRTSSVPVPDTILHLGTSSVPVYES